jgi:hypothetical protein
MAHVTVGKPLDWVKCQFDRSVRSVRFQVDKDNDLYAVPVMIMDPRGELGIIQGDGWTEGIWGFLDTCAPGVTVTNTIVLPSGWEYDLEYMSLYGVNIDNAGDRVSCQLAANWVIPGQGPFAWQILPLNTNLGAVASGVAASFAQWQGDPPLRIQVPLTDPLSPAMRIDTYFTASAVLGNRNFTVTFRGRGRRLV